MSWLFPSIVASLCGSVILTLVFCFLYYQYRERYLGFWALGWGFHALRYVFDLGLVAHWLAPESTHFIQICVLASGLLILRGAEEMAQCRMSRVFWIGGCLSGGWILLGHFADLPFLAQNLPTFLFYAAVSIRTGQLFFTVENVNGAGKYLAGWGFILWGLHRANYPFLVPLEGFLPWRFLLAALLALVVAIGMLLVYFERILTTLAVNEKRFRTLVEEATDGMFLLNLDGRILDANRHACQSLGYTKTELLQLNLHDIVEGLTDIILPQRPNRLAPGVPSTLAGRHRRKDGTGFPVDIRISVIESSTADPQLLALARDIGKQKETEDLLRQSCRKFEALYNQSFQLIGLIDPDGTLLDANQTALRLIDSDLSALQGRPIWETPWWANDLHQQVQLRKAIQQAAQGEVVRMEVRHPARNGGQLTIDFSLKPIMDEAGRVTLLIAEGRDISERIKVANALKTANLALETLFDANPMPIVAVDTGGRLTQWNQAAEDTFGWSRDEVIGHPCPLTPESDQANEQALRQRELAGEKLRGIEVVRMKKDGSTIELSRYGTRLCDDRGKPYGLMGIFVDLSERKQAERCLKESETRYRKLFQQFETLLNAIPDPITLISPDMNIVWGNQGSTRVFMQNDPASRELHCYQLRQDRDTICPECPVVDCFRTGDFQERVLTTPDGRSWGVKAFPVKDKNGAVINVLELSTEITEKLRLREEAERSNRLTALGELAAGVAHEINNPNGLILLNLPMLIEAFTDIEPVLAQYAEAHSDFSFGGLPFSRMRNEIPEMLQEMQDGALRIKRIVDDLKNFVRQDHLPSHHEVNLNQALQTAVRLTSTEIKRATDQFSASYADHLAPVNGVSQRLEQVLVNLIINACQALPDRNHGLTLTTGYDEASGMNVIEVRDQGRGIEANHLNHLTDPFFTTRRDSGGTGLGLSVSARIVKEHGGELRFASTPGQGTTVSLLLPPLKEV